MYTYRDGDDTLFANLFHRARDEVTNFPLTIGRNSPDLRNQIGRAHV